MNVDDVRAEYKSLGDDAYLSSKWVIEEGLRINDAVGDERTKKLERFLCLALVKSKKLESIVGL